MQPCNQCIPPACTTHIMLNINPYYLKFTCWKDNIYVYIRVISVPPTFLFSLTYSVFTLLCCFCPCTPIVSYYVKCSLYASTSFVICSFHISIGENIAPILCKSKLTIFKLFILLLNIYAHTHTLHTFIAYKLFNSQRFFLLFIRFLSLLFSPALICILFRVSMHLALVRHRLVYTDYSMYIGSVWI